MVEMGDKLIPNAILAWLYANGVKSEVTDYIEEKFGVSRQSARDALISEKSLQVVVDKNLEEAGTTSTMPLVANANTNAIQQVTNANDNTNAAPYPANQRKNAPAAAADYRRDRNTLLERRAADATLQRITNIDNKMTKYSNKQEINNAAAKKNLSNTRKLSNLEINIKNNYNRIRNHASKQGETRRKRLLKQKYFSNQNLKNTRKTALAGEIRLLTNDKQEKYLEYLKLKMKVNLKEIRKLTPETLPGHFTGYSYLPGQTAARTPENQEKVDRLNAEIIEISDQLDALENLKYKGKP